MSDWDNPWYTQALMWIGGVCGVLMVILLTVSILVTLISKGFVLESSARCPHCGHGVSAEATQ